MGKGNESYSLRSCDMNELITKLKSEGNTIYSEVGMVNAFEKSCQYGAYKYRVKFGKIFFNYIR